MAIDKATDKAGRTRADIAKRLLSAWDPRLKNALSQCLHGYDDALAALRLAWSDLSKGHYMELYQDANYAGRGFTSCEQAFIDNSLTSPLTTDNRHLSNYCNILQIIANASY
ncbi:pectinesterase inhibitor-like [Dorcoceras hygrometricum]|uniref:Pectinesterase inhibitor-like n=1 Tax=Dorcoceras hygrometricum TaxID=472368 RepID=A0A2Z6ZZ87_9LAMI|nr:pectinesterase inhibitor-like [Dorcoceras hygrometricum]